MYAIPLILLVLLAIVAVAWSPMFAVVAAGLLFVAFLAYAGRRPRAEEEIRPQTGSAGKYEDDTSTDTGGAAEAAPPPPPPS